MALSGLIVEPIHIESYSSQAPTTCGYCNKRLPLPHTLRRFRVERTRMSLSFDSYICAFKYEYERRDKPE